LLGLHVGLVHGLAQRQHLVQTADSNRTQNGRRRVGYLELNATATTPEVGIKQHLQPGRAQKRHIAQVRPHPLPIRPRAHTHQPLIKRRGRTEVDLTADMNHQRVASDVFDPNPQVRAPLLAGGQPDQLTRGR
jgi:hypothetical protein